MKDRSLVIAGAFFLLSSCSHYYYQPNTHNVPVFREKNEARLSGSLTLSDEVGGEIQAGYAMTQHGAVIANACLLQPNSDRSKSSRGYLYEIGGGYFTPIPAQNPTISDKFVFEVYGVAGIGDYRNYYWNQSGVYPIFMTDTQQFYYPHNYIDLHYVKAYAQPSIAFSHDNIDIIVSAKIGFIENYKLSSTLPSGALNAGTNAPLGSLTSDWQLLNENPTSFLFEPAFTLRVGYKYVKLQGQLSWAVLRTSPFLYNLGIPFTLSLGVSVDLAPRYGIFKNKSKKEEDQTAY